MGRVLLLVELGVDSRRSAKQIEKDLLKIPSVVDVWVDSETGEVTIVVGHADAATLKARLEARFGKPVKILPTPPVGREYGMMHPPAPSSAGGGYQPCGYSVMRPPTPVAWSPLPAPPMGPPYVDYNYNRPPLPEAAGYYYTPYGGSPYMWADERAGTFKDEYHRGCSCSIQ